MILSILTFNPEQPLFLKLACCEFDQLSRQLLEVCVFSLVSFENQYINVNVNQNII